MSRRWLFLTVSLLSLNALAQDAQNTVRAEFVRTYANLASEAAVNDSAALREYILYPYLTQARLRRALLSGDNVPNLDRDIEAFLRDHDKEVVSFELRRAWYASLAKRQEWERLLANYRDVNDATLQCHALTARLSLQRFENLQSAAIAAWSNASDSRPACEPVFTWLRSQGALTDALIEARERLALGAANTGFARQMIALLPKNLAEPLESWAMLIDKPRAGIDALVAAPTKPIEAAALLEGWTRLARAEPNAAIERYKKLIQARSLSKETASRFAMELALSLSWSRRADALDYFAKVRAADFDDRAFEWHARAALWNGQWKRASAVLESMSPQLKQQTKWKYWIARVNELRGKRETARGQYKALLADDNYYAALAAARLAKPYTPNPKKLAVNEEQVRVIEAQPNFLRARELQQCELTELRAFAYDEWRRGYNSLDGDSRQQSVVLASRWGWHDQAILTASQQSLFDDYELLYPRPYDAAVQKASDIVKLPTSLLYAVIRQESLYRTDWRSAAGANGLMQLIPETAVRIARRWPQFGSAIADPKDLFNATTNISLGAANLRERIDKSNGKIPVALAAYNAGPGAAERWFPKSKMDMDIWIENIPYNETRVYVQRIHWHSVIFGWLATRTGQDTTQWLTQIDASGK